MKIKFALCNWGKETKHQICSMIFRTQCWHSPKEKAIWQLNPILTQKLSNPQPTILVFWRLAPLTLLVLSKTQRLISWRKTKEIKRLLKNSTRNLTHRQDQSGMLRKQIDLMSSMVMIYLIIKRKSLRERQKVWI